MDLGKFWRTGPAPVVPMESSYDPTGYRGPALSQSPGAMGILSRLNPFPEGISPESREARSDALIQFGLGILQGNTGHYGAMLPAFAAGGMAGFQGYKNSLKEQAARRQAMLQEKLINSQIGENDAQTLKRKRDLERAQKLEENRRSIIEWMDANYSSPADELSQGEKMPNGGEIDGVPVIGGVGQRISNKGDWRLNPNGWAEAAAEAAKRGDMELSKEFFDRSKDMADLDLKRKQINKEGRPDQKLTIGSPTGGNEQWDYIYDPDKRAPGPRLAADPRYVFAGKRQAVSNTSVTTMPQQVELEGMKQLAKNDANEVEAWKKKRAEASFILPILTRMEKATKDGRTYSGTFAEFKTGIGKMLNSIGLPGVNIDKIAASEQYAADQAEVIRTKIKALGSGTGVSNVDLLFTQRSVPELVKTPEGRLQIIKAMKADLQNIIEDATSADKYFRSNKASLGGWEPPSAKKNAVIQDDDVEDIIRRNLK